MDPSDALTIARHVLVPLQYADFKYQLGGSLALYAHGIGTYGEVHSIDLFTQHDYWAKSSPRPLVMKLLEDQGYRVELAAEWTAQDPSVYRNLRVSPPGRGRPPITLTMQRWPLNAPSTVIDQIPMLDQGECVNHLLHSFYARNEPRDFVDLDAVKVFAGQERLGRFVVEFLKYRAEQIPDVPHAVHHQDFYACLAQVIRHPSDLFKECGHPNPEALRRSILQLAEHVLDATPGGSPLPDLPRLKRERVAILTAMFESLPPSQRPNAEQQNTRELRLLILEAAIQARSQAGQRARQRTGVTGPSGSASSVRQGPVHPSSAEPPPRQGPRW